MENNKYLDKVVGSLVRSTKMDYENKEVNTPFPSPSSIPSFFSFPFLTHPPSFPPLFLSFSSYCKNTFGLTEEEMGYVWKEYRNIINDKIENEQ